MKVIVFPHAGGFGITYRPLVKLMGGSAGVRLYDYRGHGARMNEAFDSSIYDVIDEAAQFIRTERQDGESICLFGHSAGAVIAYEAAAELERTGEPVDWLALSGHDAPDVLGKIPEDDGIDAYLMEMGGTSEEVLRSAEYRKYLYPVVRSDFHLLRQYSCAVPHPVLHHTRGMILWGEEDSSMSPDGIDRWTDFFEEKPKFRPHRGGHFYLYDCWEQVGGELRALKEEGTCPPAY